MTRVLVVGAGGRMGQSLIRMLEGAEGLRLGAALEHAAHPQLGREVAHGVKLGADARAACAEADVAVDFSSHASTLALLDAAEPRRLPLVIGTTGLELAAEADARIARAAERLAIVRAANFSIGVTVLLELVAEAARRLEGYEIDVLEMHHDQKKDAPSGTALALARSAAAARGQDLQHAGVYARHGQTGVRDPKAIGLQALRLGDSVGEHTVYFAGPGERVELAHRALSRDNFAAGALRAARWLVGRKPGLYGMRDVLTAP
jgi:4-hydroxy-tetrahydrodipicolinate reductase